MYGVCMYIYKYIYTHNITIMYILVCIQLYIHVRYVALRCRALQRNAQTFKSVKGSNLSYCLLHFCLLAFFHISMSVSGIRCLC